MFFQVLGLLCRCHNDVTGLVFEHNLTDAEIAKINETFLDK